MHIKTFWTIVIKIIGLWLLFSCISVIPQFLSSFPLIEGNDNMTTLLLFWAGLLATMIVYLVIIRLFLFRPDWLIAKLRLERNFTEERLDINYDSSSVISIAVIAIGAMVVVESLPAFCSRLFDFLRQKSLFRDYAYTGWLVFNFVKVIIGYLLMTNGRNVAALLKKYGTNKAPAKHDEA